MANPPPNPSDAKITSTKPLVPLSLPPFLPSCPYPGVSLPLALSTHSSHTGKTTDKPKSLDKRRCALDQTRTVRQDSRHQLLYHWVDGRNIAPHTPIPLAKSEPGNPPNARYVLPPSLSISVPQKTKTPTPQPRHAPPPHRSTASASSPSSPIPTVPKSCYRNSSGPQSVKSSSRSRPDWSMPVRARARAQSAN